MKKSHLIMLTLFRIFVFIVIPVALIVAVNVNYPGLLTDRYLLEITIATIVGALIVLFYFLSDISERKKKMIYETIALTLVLVYTVLILGFGNAEFHYDKLKIYLYYLPLFYLIIAGIVVRYPVILLRYLAGE